MNWIQHPLILEGEKVRLVPLDATYFDALVTTGNDERVWEHMAIKGWQGEELLTALKSSLLKRMNHEEYPFVVIDKLTGNVIGSTRYIEIYPQFRKLEIGWTWYNPVYWGKGHNQECKLLLLTHAFETLQCVRVQFTARDTNLRSRAAIEKTGAKLEGILRNYLIRFDLIRNSAMYSITDTEWPEVKQKLQEKVLAQ